MNAFPAYMLRLFFFIILSVFISACSKAPEAPEGPSLDAKRTIAENAEVVFLLDSLSMKSTPFGKLMQEYEREAENRQTPVDMAWVKELTEASGVNEDNVSTLAFSLSNLSAVDRSNYHSVRFVFAAHLSDVIDADELYAYLSAKADEKGNELERENFEGAELFKGKLSSINVALLSDKMKSANVELVIAVVNGTGESLLVGGDEASVKAAVTRVANESDVDLSRFQTLSNGMPGEVHMAFALRLTGDMQEKLMVNAQSPVLAMLGVPPTVAQALGKAAEFGISATASDVMDLSLQLALGSAEDASTVATILNETLLSMVQMLAATQLGETPPFVGSMKAEASNANVWLNMSLNEEDLRIFNKNAQADAASGSH